MKRLSHEQVSLVARRARALGDATRVRIVELLGRSEQHVGQIAATLGLQPSTVSKHLQVLFHVGLVERRRSASTVIYSLPDHRIIECCHYLGPASLRARTPRG